MPNPPGTHETASGGQSANEAVGNRLKQTSVGTGSVVFPAWCTPAFGTRDSTCVGRSSWVTREKSRKPMCSVSSMAGRPA
jgi:hypothetical protein